jgi:hypothetical protein
MAIKTRTHAPQQTAELFDHLISDSKHSRRNGEAECLGCLDIDLQLYPLTAATADSRTVVHFTWARSGPFNGLPVRGSSSTPGKPLLLSLCFRFCATVIAPNTAFA